MRVLLLCFFLSLFSCFSQYAYHKADTEKIQCFNVEQTNVYTVLDYLKKSVKAARKKHVTKELIRFDYNLKATCDQFVELATKVSQGVLEDFPKVESVFYEACFLYPDITVDSIRLRHVRRIRKKMKKLQVTLKESFLTRDFFHKECEDIRCELMSFNYKFLHVILENYSFDTGMIDSCLDLLVYRPVDWVKEHPVLTGVIGSALVLLLICWKLGLFESLPNHPEVTQGKSLNQRGSTCGFHAVYNLICHRNNQEPSEQGFNDFYQMAQGLVGGTTQNLSNLQVQTLLEGSGLSKAESELTRRGNTTLIQNRCALDNQGIRQDMGLSEKKGRLHGQQHMPQYFVLNTGVSPEKTRWYNGSYHYISGVTEWLNEQLITTVYDSFYNRNRRNDKSVIAWHNFFKKEGQDNR